MENANNNVTSDHDQLPTIAFIYSPGMGHLIPIAELAKRLVCDHGFAATFITYTNFSSPEQSSHLARLHPNISSIPLPFIPLHDLPSDARIETVMATLVSRSVPHVRDALFELKKTARVAAFVPDLLCSDLLPVAEELSIPRYLFFASNCKCLLFFLHFPALHAATTCEYHNLPEPLLLPGCLPLPGTEFIDTVTDRTNDAVPWIVHVMNQYACAEGFLVNSFEKMEPGASKALKDEKDYQKPVYLVGPCIRPVENDETDELGCLDWLNLQPKGSVLYVSFGSGGTLSVEQTTELALGLEASDQRFLWVARCPNDTDKSGSFFNSQGNDINEDPLNYLPKGFLERNKERCMVVASWAPQVRVLAHEAVGGFLTHCGWNSAMESVWSGVPMIAWPLYAEQRMNRMMLVDGVGIALKPVAREEDGVVERGAVAAVVRELMEGEKGKVVRGKVEELKEAAVSALKKGGSSEVDLKRIADQWKDGVKELV